MFRCVIILALLAGLASGNTYYYQPYGCEADKFYQENNQVGTPNVCDQIGNTKYYDITTDTSIAASNDWNNYSYAEFRHFSDGNCQTFDHWVRRRLGDGMTYLITSGETTAHCELINGKEYFYFEDSIGQKSFATETGSCVSFGTQQTIITCVKKKTTTVVSPSSVIPKTSTASTAALMLPLLLFVCGFSSSL